MSGEVWALVRHKTGRLEVELAAFVGSHGEELLELHAERSSAVRRKGAIEAAEVEDERRARSQGELFGGGGE